LFSIFLVTEKEIFKGILNGKNVANNVLFFERNIVDIEENLNMNTSLVKKFVDLDKHNKVDNEIKTLLENLKHEKIPSALPKSNIFKFDVSISYVRFTKYIKLCNKVCYRSIGRKNAVLV
jgi:hypothetical protein